MDHKFAIRIKGREQLLLIGNNYYFEFKDPEETSFHLLRSKVMDIYWKDAYIGKAFFFIYVHDHNEDYLISDEEIISAKLSDLTVGKIYKFIMDNGSTLTGEFIGLKKIGEIIHSVWIDIGRQPVYLDYRDITEIIELNIDFL